MSHMSVLTRRQALGVIGAAGAASLVALDRARRAWAASCALTPEETEGPYWVEEGLDRSDITVDPSDGSVRPGVPLQLNLNVLVWHCDAGGLYSDEAANGTVGKRFLRGYQTTDANGAVRFTTIYPGWYSGRTIHIHFRVRTFDGATTTTNFTSQVFFDDAISNQVLAQSPYNTRGTRDTTNANDNIFTSATLLTLTGDGNGGYVGTFDVALDSLPGTSGGGACAEVTACVASLDAMLPDPASATDGKSRRVANHLAHLAERAATLLDRASSSAGTKQTRLYRKARAALDHLVAVATAADTKGTLGVSLASIDAAVTAVLALVPSA